MQALVAHLLVTVLKREREKGCWLLVKKRCDSARELRGTWQWDCSTEDEYMIMSMWNCPLNKLDFKLGRRMRLRRRRLTRRIRGGSFQCNGHSITHPCSLQTTATATTTILILIICVQGRWMRFSRQLKLKSEQQQQNTLLKVEMANFEPIFILLLLLESPLSKVATSIVKLRHFLGRHFVPMAITSSTITTTEK